MQVKSPPKLALVVPRGLDKPPRPLGEHGMKLWRAILREYAFDDAGGREALAQICAALDTAEACAAEVLRDGTVIRSKTGMREHPALRGELANRAFVVRSLSKLGLVEYEPKAAVGRPPLKSFPQ
jgi:hypothetical protein